MRRDPVERFWSFVDRSGECWLWIARRERQEHRVRVAQDRVRRHVERRRKEPRP